MKSMMRAFQFADVSKGLELRDVPIPKPGEGEVLVQVRAAGLCHTDCNVISGKDDILPSKRPMTLGHEIAGVIVELGPGVTNFSVNDRVVSGIAIKHPVTVDDVVTTAGIGYDGGYAEFVVITTSKAVRIPDGVTFAQAAVATDAVATAYHAVVVEGQVSASSNIGIVGLGGLGLSAVQIASYMGAKVYGIDISAKKYVAALEAGASVCAKTLDKLSGVHFDVIVDFAGAGTTTAAAVKALQPGGRLVLVGLAAKEATLNTYELVSRGVSLKGTAGSTVEEVAEVLGLIAKGKIHPILEEIAFADIPKGLDRITKGDTLGRLHADPTKTWMFASSGV
ncbi:chaperonin 10-like protein [Aspergillus pseudoustus]|uniref:Chaperonin 10-like protein n=1 Tax=Aspergillus pseudoustus TaxID=1810923 RepID=A0ABR4JG83_9EURO